MHADLHVCCSDLLPVSSGCRTIVHLGGFPLIVCALLSRFFCLLGLISLLFTLPTLSTSRVGGCDCSLALHRCRSVVVVCFFVICPFLTCFRFAQNLSCCTVSVPISWQWSDAPQAPPPAWAAGDSLERSKLRFNWNPCHADCSVEQSVRKRMRTLRSTVLGSRQVLESVANVAVVLWLLRCQLRSHRRTHTRGSQKAQWPVFCRCPNHVSCAQKYDDGSFFLCHGT